MPRIPVRSYGPALIATGPTTVITVPAGEKLILRLIHVQNPSGSIVTFTLSIGADAAGTRLWQTYNIPAAAAGVSDNVRTIPVWIPMEAAEILTLSAGTNNILTITISAERVILG
jgi:hypothetical protein